MTTVAIMQPTFIPWMGYFALMRSVDEFVFLDTVQLSKPSWQNRNRIKGPNGEVMLTIPMARSDRFPMIKDAKFAPNGFERKMRKTIQSALQKTPYVRDVLEIFDGAFDQANGSLAALNISIIDGFAKRLGISCACHLASDLGDDADERSERLVQIVRQLGGAVYLSPVGSMGYLEQDNGFEGSGIDLRFINFEHPVYQQPFGPFLSHMAILDGFANCGPQETLRLIDQGIKAPKTLDELKREAHANL